MPDSEGLRLPCKHGRYDRHHLDWELTPVGFRCPGGYKPTTEAEWYCKTHRASESVEEGTCEVAGLLWNLATGPMSDCEFVKRLLVTPEVNE